MTAEDEAPGAWLLRDQAWELRGSMFRSNADTRQGLLTSQDSIVALPQQEPQQRTQHKHPQTGKLVSLLPPRPSPKPRPLTVLRPRLSLHLGVQSVAKNPTLRSIGQRALVIGKMGDRLSRHRLALSIVSLTS